MSNNHRGIIQCPTGGGKTYTFVMDSRKHMSPGSVLVVVAPRLLLIEQLFFEFDKHLSDIDFLYREISSESRKLQRDRKSLKFRITPPFYPTTNISEIRDTYRVAVKQQKPLVLFVTYDSLERVVSSGLPLEVVYYDEAHNAASNDNFQNVKQLSMLAKRNYFFTATPRYSKGFADNSAGMNNVNVYGEIICQVKFNDLVAAGVIVKPKIHLQRSDCAAKLQREVDVNRKTIAETIEYYEKTFSDSNHKILFCTQGTKSIADLITSGIVEWANEQGYAVLTTDSVNGQLINGEKIQKDKFLKKLNELGEDPNKKMLVFHYSQIAEGIDIKAFTGVVFLRQSMSDIFTAQSIGRVIRSSPGKKFGVVTIVEHSDDTGEARNNVEFIVQSLVNNGVPPEVFLSEEDGRAKVEEVVEELPSSVQTLIRQTLINWEHSNMLEKLLQCDPLEVF